VCTIELLERGGQFSLPTVGRWKDQNSTNETLTILPSTKIVIDKVLPEQTENQLYVSKTKTMQVLMPVFLELEHFI
jgi:hypothetical protein